MHTEIRARRITGWRAWAVTGRMAAMLGLCLMLGMTTGCNQMLAKYSRNQAEKRITEAQENEAERFVPEMLEQARSLANTAQSQIDSQQYREARQTASEAAQLSKDLLAQAKYQRATFLKEEAYRWLNIADLNQGQQENADLYNQIKENYETGQRQYDKENYEDAIETLVKVIQDFQFLLRNLENAAKQGLTEAMAMKDELIEEGAPDNAPEYVLRLDEQIEQIRSLIEQDINYRAALIARDQARQIKQEGIQATKEERSRKMLQNIENLLDEATALGANIYALQNFNEISKDFENLLKQFYDRNYDMVLTTAPKLEPRVEELILETKREAAAAKIRELDSAINTLVDSEARSYLPGRVENLEALLGEARNLFEQQDFTESKARSERGLEYFNTVMGEFDELAQQQIQNASEQLAIAEGVYDTMQGIFDHAIPGNWSGDDLALEQGKQALKEELRAMLNNARLALGVAELKRSEKDFNVAIETARQVAGQAEEVQQQTYRVVAHNAILEIANELSRYEGQGGRQYAAAELDRTGAMLEESKDLLAEGEFRDAVRRAADTKAQLEILVQELQRVAVSQIEQAQTALSEAQANRAPRYAGEGFNQAAQSLEQARRALEGEGLKEAIESAISAEELAEQVSTASLRQWSLDLLEQSAELLTEAKTAGADRYAPDQLMEAQDRRDVAVQLFNQGAFQQSIDAGQNAVDAAHEALYSKVNEAENAVATARRFEGWEYEPQRLSQAMVSAQNAREAMRNNDYRLAEQFATASLVQATDVTQDAKRKAFEHRLSQLEAHIAEASRKGTGYYQINDLTRLVADMHALRAQFDPTDYIDYSRRVELIEAQLAGLMELTPQVLQDVIDAMNLQLAALEQRGARNYMPEKLEEIEREIKFAVIDFKAANYRPSYQNAKDAQMLLDQVTLKMAERDYDAALSGQFERFVNQLHGFAPVLNMGSPALMRLITTNDGHSQAFALMHASSPSDLRTELAEIGEDIRQMTPPPTRVELHEAAVETLKLAQVSASNFEKLLILDHYSRGQAREIVQEAFLQMYQARSQQMRIQAALEHPQAGFDLRGVERVVSYHGF